MKLRSRMMTVIHVYPIILYTHKQFQTILRKSQFENDQKIKYTTKIDILIREKNCIRMHYHNIDLD